MSAATSSALTGLISPDTEGSDAPQAADVASKPTLTHPVRFRLLRPKDLHHLPQASFAIDSLLPMQGVVCVFGASQAGKSALMLSLVAAFAHGEPWFCRLTRRLRVCYVVLEGATGMVLRAEALQKHSGKDLPDTVRFIVDEFSLKSDVEELCDRIKKAGGTDVLIIDTLFCAMAGEDENSSQGMWHAVAGAKALQKAIGGLVILVHHTGKDATRGMRGHSSLNAALDAAIEVVRRDEYRSWRLVKSRDSEDNIAGAFALQRVELPPDNDGRLRCSVVAVPVEVEEAPEPARQLPKNQAAALSALKTALNDLEDDEQSIEAAAALELVKEAMETDQRHRKQRAQEALEGLRKVGLLVEEDGRYRLADNTP